MYWLVASMFYGLAASRSLWVASAALSETDRGRNDRCRGISPVRLPAAPGAPHRGLSVGEVQSENMTHTHTHTHTQTHTHLDETTFWACLPSNPLSVVYLLPTHQPRQLRCECRNIMSWVWCSTDTRSNINIIFSTMKVACFWGMCCLLKSFED